MTPVDAPAGDIAYRTLVNNLFVDADGKTPLNFGVKVTANDALLTDLYLVDGLKPRQYYAATMNVRSPVSDLAERSARQAESQRPCGTRLGSGARSRTNRSSQSRAARL